jgi:uncharacterized membrane protein
MSRKLKLFVLISVILNVTLIGIIAGYGYHHFGVKRGDKIIALLDRSSLSEDKRNSFKEKLQNIFPNENKRKNRQKWRDETLAILTAEELDVSAYRAQLEKMIVRRNQNKREQVETMVEIASHLNQSERKDLAEIFSRKR